MVQSLLAHLMRYDGAAGPPEQCKLHAVSDLQVDVCQRLRTGGGTS